MSTVEDGIAKGRDKDWDTIMRPRGIVYETPGAGVFY